LLGWRGVIEEYRSHLPIPPGAPVVTLLEGGTPLVPAPRLSERVGASVYLKVEGANPTGSFKDRGMTVAISSAVAGGAEAVVCASTGNTSASAAAYASRAGLKCVVLIPEGHIALGKLAQALIHGARVLQVRGNFRQAGRATKLPKMLGFQAAGAAPIVLGHVVDEPETVATAIRIGNPASWYSATAAAAESGGSITSVTDQQILAAYRLLAEEESVFCEAASAASVAGLLESDIPAGSTVVCVLTGHGLKDPDLAISQIDVPNVVDADIDAILAQLD